MSAQQQGDNSKKGVDNIIAQSDPDIFEQEFVTNVYNDIAPHFSLTRYKPWPFIDKFLKSKPLGTLIADVGCGNGKYMDVNKACMMIGSDMCVIIPPLCFF